MIETHKYTRKPFVVEAVEVTNDNMQEVATWCEGLVVAANDGPYIKVEVQRPLSERQTRAFAGDWVLFAGTGYKVYKARAFEKTFVRASDDLKVDIPRKPIARLTKAQAENAGIKPPIETKI